MLQKITWKNPIKKPATNAVGDDADADRFKKMPDENAIMAIANIAARQTQNLNRRDILTTSLMNLLLAAPSRAVSVACKLVLPTSKAKLDLATAC